MSKHRVLRWICTGCKKKVEAKGKPDRCNRCKNFGTFVFYGAQVVK